MILTLTPSGLWHSIPIACWIHGCIHLTLNVRNDILRARGILPQKDEKTEEEINSLIDEVIAERVAKETSLEDKTLDELDELEDEHDDRIILEYR